MDVQDVIGALNPDKRVSKEILDGIKELIRIRSSIFHVLLMTMIITIMYIPLIWYCESYTEVTLDLLIYFAVIYTIIYIISAYVLHKYVKMGTKIQSKLVNKGWCVSNITYAIADSRKTRILFLIFGGVSGLSIIVEGFSYIESYIMGIVMLIFISAIPYLTQHLAKEYTFYKLYKGNIDDYAHFIGGLPEITKKISQKKNIKFYKTSDGLVVRLRCCGEEVPNGYVMISIYRVLDKNLMTAMEIARKLDGFSKYMTR